MATSNINIDDIATVLGGGKVYFSTDNGANETEIAIVKDLQLAYNTDTFKATKADGQSLQDYAEFIIKSELTFSFSTEHITAENIARFFGGVKTQHSLSTSQKNLDGSTVSTAKTVDLIILNKAIAITGSLLFVSDYQTKGGGKNLTVRLPNVTLKGDGQFNLQNLEGVANLAFTGSALEGSYDWNGETKVGALFGQVG